MQSSTFVEIAPALRTLATARELIVATATAIYFLDPLLKIPAVGEGVLFRVRSDGYELVAQLDSNGLTLTRNGTEANTPLPDGTLRGKLVVQLMWSPEYLEVRLLDQTYGDALHGGADPEFEYNRNHARVVTTPVLPPPELARWARAKAIVPATTYATRSDFVAEVIAGLIGLQTKIRDSNMYPAFWDVVRDGRRVVGRRPKRETEIHPTLQGLLYDVATAKNFELIPEHQSAGGRLDFLIAGNLADGTRATACLEFKHAHSADIEHGLVTQLTTYMTDRSADFGIYGVLWFRSMDLKEPARFDTPIDLDLHLLRLQMKHGLRDRYRCNHFRSERLNSALAYGR